MTISDHLRPIDLARAVGISVQTVRRYEEFGFLPAAERSPTGYRQYDERHRQALLTSRTLIRGYGWLSSQRVMILIHDGDVDAALVLVDARHAAIAAGREQAEETLRALKTVAAGDELSPERLHQPIRIGEAARQVGVRVSTLRFWEQQGVLHPSRSRGNAYRLFDERELVRLQVVVLLRQARYNFTSIRSVLTELGAGRVATALSAVGERKVQLAAESRRCAAATAALWSYLENQKIRNEIQ